MAFLFALTPILLILILMVGLRWSAARAGGAGYLSALLIALFFFGAGPELLAFAHARALLLSVDVLLIVWAAFLLFRVVDESGAIRIMGEFLPRLTPDTGMQALIIGWGFASFLQGIGGFGVPVAVTAPMLVGLGFSPLNAVIIPSIGHGWGVTFGSLGSSFQAMLATTGLPAQTLVKESALFLGIFALVTGPMIAHIAQGWEAVQRLIVPSLLMGAAMLAGQYGVAVLGFWNIATMTGGLAGLLIGIAFAFLVNRRNPQDEKSGLQTIDFKKLALSMSVYAILVVIILLVQVFPPVRDFLRQFTIQVQFPETVTAMGFVTPAGPGRSLALLQHTGAVLTYASLITFMLFRSRGMYQPGAAKRIANSTVRGMLSSSVSIASMVTMAVIMENSGMTDTLARAIASGVGEFFPVASGWIGGIGAFMTGSNTNSNVVLSALQMRTAELLGYPLAIILAGQNAGAGIASVMAPTKVVVGASTAGMAGKEGVVMRKMALYVLILMLLGSAMTVIGVLVSAP